MNSSYWISLCDTLFFGVIWGERLLLLEVLTSRLAMKGTLFGVAEQEMQLRERGAPDLVSLRVLIIGLEGTEKGDLIHLIWRSPLRGTVWHLTSKVAN